MGKEIKTVLIAEDDFDLREQMLLYLESQGYKVLAADGESSAMKLIESEKFDLAVLDLMMENMDSGFLLSHRIKKKDKTIPVIIVTGVTRETGMHFDASTTQERSWIKADAIIQKGIRLEQLKQEIDKFLKR